MAIQATIKNTKVQIGDTISVYQEISEGKKSRVQAFEGILIAIQNRQDNKSFTVRKIATNSIGVEKIFPINLPSITKVTVVRTGKVRRSKLYFLRGRIGKQATQLKKRAISQSEKAN